MQFLHDERIKTGAPLSYRNRRHGGMAHADQA
jgi:hypothetical protein